MYALAGSNPTYRNFNVTIFMVAFDEFMRLEH